MSLKTFSLLAVLRWPLAFVYLYLKFAVWYLTLPFRIIKKVLEVTEITITWVMSRFSKIL
jgi:hypothetical protein